MSAKAKLFEKKLTQLRNTFRDQLPSRIEKIKTWIETLAIGSNNSATIDQIHRSIHSLTGSAGTFGYGELSIKTRELEKILLAVAEGAVPADADEIESIKDLFQEIYSLSKSAPVDSHKTENTQPINIAKQGGSDNARKKLIYVVDDDYELAQNLAVRLAQFDYKVECFIDAASAVAATEENTPFAMLIDVMLSEGQLSGPELAHKINAINSEIPVIFMSMRNDWQARLACVRAGGSAYLPKPVKINEVVEKLDVLVKAGHEEPFRILIVDDDEVLAQHYAILLNQAGMETTVVSDISQILEVLAKNKPELILMDLYMPESTGIEAASIIRQIDDYLDVPIVYLSTETGIEQKMDALKMGGDDFLQKPIDDNLLVESIALRTRRFRHLRSVMERDGLTGLVNRIGLDLELERELARAERENVCLVFAMIDVDHFKSVNDQYGHQIGDNVLKTMARLLTQRMRKSDIIGRYGGEEFGVILPNTDPEQAMKLLNELRESFSQISHARFAGDFKVTFSAGLAAFPVYEHTKLLIKAADDALYEAKESGRNRVVCDTSSLEAQ